MAEGRRGRRLITEDNRPGAIADLTAPSCACRSSPANRCAPKRSPTAPAAFSPRCCRQASAPCRPTSRWPRAPRLQSCPNDRVDVIMVAQERGDPIRTETVLSNIRVLAIDQQNRGGARWHQVGGGHHGDAGADPPIRPRSSTSPSRWRSACRSPFAAWRMRRSRTRRRPNTSSMVVTAIRSRSSNRDDRHHRSDHNGKHGTLMRRRGLNVTRIGQRLPHTRRLRPRASERLFQPAARSDPGAGRPSVLRITDAGPGMKKEHQARAEQGAGRGPARRCAGSPCRRSDACGCRHPHRPAHLSLRQGRGTDQHLHLRANGREIVSLDLESSATLPPPGQSAPLPARFRTSMRNHLRQRRADSPCARRSIRRVRSSWRRPSSKAARRPRATSPPRAAMATRRSMPSGASRARSSISCASMARTR